VVTCDLLKELIAKEGIEFVDFKIVDLIGRWRHITIPASQFTPHLVENGIAFDLLATFIWSGERVLSSGTHAGLPSGLKNTLSLRVLQKPR
jgi:glutamine synthetase